jgi:hypothetical protein
MIQGVKDPIDARLHARSVRVQKDLLEPIACLLFVRSDADGERLPKVGHVRLAVQLGEITVHHQFEQADNATVLPTENSIALDAQFLEAKSESLVMREQPSLNVSYFLNSRVSIGFLSVLLFVITRTKSSISTSCVRSRRMPYFTLKLPKM